MSGQLASLNSTDRERSTERTDAGAGAMKRSWAPAVWLFFVAPLVAEFLLGNMSITHLGMLALLAPLYGGGALLIRESVRGAGRGWPSIFLLALAYGVLEEGILMQSLFNPDFLGLHQHLLAPAYLPGLGIGAWWTVFVLTLHTVWSISVPVALVEALFPEQAGVRWTGRRGLAFVAVLFVLACVAIGVSTVQRDPHHFVASSLQYSWSAAVIVMLAATAFALPRGKAGRRAGRTPNAWIPGIWTLALGSAFLVAPSTWGWGAVGAYFGLDLLAIVLVLSWSGTAGWSGLHQLSLAGGAALAYGCHAFVETPALGSPGAVTRAGNAVFLVLAVGLIVFAAKNTYTAATALPRE